MISNSFMLSSFILQKNIQGHCKYALIRNNNSDDYTNDESNLCAQIFLLFFIDIRARVVCFSMFLVDVVTAMSACVVRPH